MAIKERESEKEEASGVVMSRALLALDSPRDGTWRAGIGGGVQGERE